MFVGDVLTNKNWNLELNEYIRQGEPDKLGKSNAWKTAIGLQPLKYLIETAKDHIEGRIRDYNITKDKWVLKGDTVLYASFESIRDTLDYYFSNEKKFLYKGLSIYESIQYLAKFTSRIWQIHPYF